MKDHSSKWLTYSGAAAAFLATTNKAVAQMIVFTDVDPDEHLENETFDIDFDSDGVVDVSVVQSYTSNTWNNLELPSGNAVIATHVQGWVYASVLSAGYFIDQTSPNFIESPNALLLLQSYAEFAQIGLWRGQHSFAGIRFEGGDGNTHYGWIELSVPEHYHNGLLTVYGYAYETYPNGKIQAGDRGITTGVSDVDQRFLISGPNPTRDLTTFGYDASSNGTVNLSVVNGIGRIMQTKEIAVTSGPNQLPLDLSAIPSGIYFVRLQDQGKVAYRKVVKE